MLYADGLLKQCEAEYPELCKVSQQLCSREKEETEKVYPRHRTITIEEIQATDDMWTINEPMYWTINIYGSYDDYLESGKPFTFRATIPKCNMLVFR